MLVLSSVQLCVTPWTVAHQVILPMGFSRQKYWRGWPFPPPEDLPKPGIKPMSPALAGGFFTTEPTMEYYSAIKKNEICICNVDGPREYYTSEISQTEEDKYSMLSLICGI